MRKKYLKWRIDRGRFSLWLVAERSLYVYTQLTVEWDSYRFHMNIGLLHFMYVKGSPKRGA